MEAREVFPVFSQLHSESTEPSGSPDAGERAGPRLIAFARRPKPQRKKRRNRAVRREGKPSTTQRRAPGIDFTYEQETRTDTQKAIHAVAYLLEWAAESGNQPLEGVAADGLSVLLRKSAAAVGRMFTITELRAAGGDPKELHDGEVRP